MRIGWKARIDKDHLVRMVDLWAARLDPADLDFTRAAHARTGRPGCHPSVLPKLFINGYLNRVPSSRRLDVPRIIDAAMTRIRHRA